MKAGNAVVAQSDEMGALPVLFAATQPGVDGRRPTSAPTGIGEHRGHPKIVRPNGAARDEVTARRLWEVSEELTRPAPIRLRISRTATGSVVRS